MRLFFSLSILTLFTFACKQEKSAPAATTPVTVTLQEYNFEKCVKDSVCARIKVSWPVLAGGANPAAIKAINDSLELYARDGLMNERPIPLKQALDSAGLALYTMLQEEVKGFPEWTAPFEQEVFSATLFQNAQIISFDINATGFTGGAHGYYAATIATFELATGKELSLTDIIADTVALRPMLEKAFVEEKKADDPTATLKDLLLNPESPLALPVNVCIVAEGVNFFYNPYEVSAWAVGPTAITLTWAQLGALADRKKWGVN